MSVRSYGSMNVDLLIACCRPLDDTGLTVEEAEATAALFKALGDPARGGVGHLLRTRLGPRLRLRADTASRSLAADREPSPEEARPGRSAPARAAGRLGLLQPRPRGHLARGGDPRAGRSAGMTTDLREQVRARYAEAARGIADGTGCGCDCESIGCA